MKAQLATSLANQQSNGSCGDMSLPKGILRPLKDRPDLKLLESKLKQDTDLHKKLKLCPAERYYDVGDREWLAVVKALKAPGSQNTKADVLSRLYDTEESSVEPSLIHPASCLVAPVVCEVDADIELALRSEPSPPQCPEGCKYVPLEIFGPPFFGDENAYFLSFKRNKKSIAVNLKDPKGTKVILELAGMCDVLVENDLPGKLDQMGLGYDHVHKVAPRLVYCSISGHTHTGPLSQRPGYDSVSAVSGMIHITGPEVGDPVRPGVAMTDLATVLYTHVAIMTALLQRHRTGRGVHIDCNLLSTQVACFIHVATNYLNSGKEARR
ncbi:succinate--hydroxymethylglutarate CoA-transferase-like [Coregonus clupeaformis]|uniref:succinate--hydroxymethylglutarate CoA-transferase-like n=1 Tax=Coregonus clupeaformis TaxID=59861 RepID=UPI001E1C5750|nr:succinate--hydroxymethylglutarate CoA-transferase-like [Coregonus clupeaformis]